MPKQITMFILHLDVLGFEAIAQEIEKKTEIITTKKVRSDFLATIQERISFCQGQFTDLNIHYEESDNWLILHRDLEVLLYVISLLLSHDTNYSGFEYLPLEIAIGKGVFDESSKFSGRELIVEDEIIKFLKKTSLIKNFKDWYKRNEKKSIKTTFILLEENCFYDLSTNHHPYCELIQFEDNSCIYQIITEYLQTLKDTMPLPSSPIDKSFLTEFHSWRENEYPEEFYTNPTDETPDTIFFLLIPSTCRKDLVNLSADFTKPELSETGPSGVTVSISNPAFKPEIWHYLNEYNLLASYIGVGESTEIVNTPDEITLKNKFTGSQIFIRSSGLIYGKFNITDLTLNKRQKDFREFFFIPEMFLDVVSDWLDVTKAAEKYGTPITELVHRDIEQIITILCFLFNPSCKKHMVKKSCEDFLIRIVFPGLILEEIPRVLYEKNPPFPYNYRRYKGKKRELVFEKELEFNSIPAFFQELENYIHGYFH